MQESPNHGLLSSDFAEVMLDESARYACVETLSQWARGSSPRRRTRRRSPTGQPVGLLRVPEQPEAVEEVPHSHAEVVGDQLDLGRIPRGLALNLREHGGPTCPDEHQRGAGGEYLC